jgi:5-formyltetrahydrofolate cyclo-ligase
MIAPHAAVDAMNKTTLRGQALRARNALAEAERARLSEAIAERAGEIIISLLPDCVALYRPIGSECDTRALMVKATSTGAEIALPAIIDKTTIVFRRFMPGDTLVAGGFGTTFPSAQAPTVQPDVIVLPVVAFDRAGMRLGYGRGFYDRAVASQRAAGRHPKLLGVAFAVQEVTGIPHEPHDVRLDWIVTDKEILDFTVADGADEG